jgi:5-methylcytosine-specific restriction endonuclease McrA
MSLKTRASSNNQRAREAMLQYNLHEHDIRFMLDYFEGHCAYCNTLLEKDGWWVDHVIPITADNIEVINYGSVAYNCVPSCIDCNVDKGVKDLEMWLNYTFDADDAESILYKINEYQNICGISDIIW